MNILKKIINIKNVLNNNKAYEEYLKQNSDLNQQSILSKDDFLKIWNEKNNSKPKGCC